MHAYVIKPKHQTRDRASVTTKGKSDPVLRFYTPMSLSENMHTTPEGYLLCMNVPIARTGQQVYAAGETPIEPGPDGQVIIDRKANEVFRPETIASFEGKPFTIYHPNEFVNPDNWNELARGVAQNVRRGSGEHEGSLLADILVTAKKAIERIQSGLREISCGYDAEYHQTGIGRGEQRNILGNHIALVDEGRAGSSHAIKDHKGKVAMSLKDQLKKMLGKHKAEVTKLVSQTEDGVDAGDEDEDEEEGVTATNDAAMNKRLDRIEKLVTKALAKPTKAKTKDFMTEPSQSDPAHPGAADAGTVEERLAKLEAMMTSFMESQAEKQASVGDDEEEVEAEAEDADEEEKSEESEDEECDDADEGDEEEFKGKKKTGDTASRVEILAPGMKAIGANAKAKSLVACFATKDGKAAILKLTGGKKPNFKDAAQVNMLFVGASEMLANERTGGLAATRVRDNFVDSSFDAPKGAKTPEQINEINRKHYAAQAAK